jgi:hypothetical protein
MRWEISHEHDGEKDHPDHCVEDRCGKHSIAFDFQSGAQGQFPFAFNLYALTVTLINLMPCSQGILKDFNTIYRQQFVTQRVNANLPFTNFGSASLRSRSITVPKAPLNEILFSSFFRAYLRFLLDSFLYPDLAPFCPLRGNVFVKMLPAD